MVATATKSRIGVDDDPLAMLDAMATATSSRKKGETPTVQRPDLANALASWEQNKAKEDHYKSLRETAEAQIIAAAADERIKACQAARDILSTVKISAMLDGGTRPFSVSVTQQSRYTKIKTETATQRLRLDQLRQTLGDDFDKYIDTELEVKLSPAATDDQAFLKQFVSLMMQTYGAEEFKKRFTVTKGLCPTKQFHRDYALEPDFREAVKPFVNDETIKPYKPSVKQ